MQNTAQLHVLITARLAVLDQRVSIFESQGRDAAVTVIANSSGLRTRRAIHALTDRMHGVESALQSARGAVLTEHRLKTFVALLASLAMMLGILVYLFLTIRREMLARTDAQLQLQGVAARIGAILAAVADGIITINERGRIETFNPAAEQLFGYRSDEVIDQNVNMLMPEPYHNEHDGYLQRFRETGQARIIGIGREVLGRHKNGATFPMELSVTEMRIGEQRHFTGVVHDITARKYAEELLRDAKEKAERANRAKDSFLATMSHEIRTPLTGMLGMLEVLSLSPLDQEQERTLRVAWDSSRSLLRIVSDILDWSKIEEGKLALVPRSASIPQILQEVVNTYSRVASAKSLSLTQRADPRLQVAYIVDAHRLSQILNNFVSNAIKFTERGMAEVNAELLERNESGDQIRFSVRDTGRGIPEDVQRHLFQRYRQESEDTARMYGGTGLGLAICRRLTELMDGQLELTSAPDLGSTFSVTLVLPVSAAPGEFVANLQPDVAQRQVEPLFDGGPEAPLVLAVDDHPINRDLLARQLKLLGFRVDTAENGHAALSRWQENSYALVISDVHMPEMDGYSMARAIRRIEAEQRSSRVPIIAWTANAVGDETGNCRAAGMDDVLTKPTNLARVRSALAKFLAPTTADADSTDGLVPDSGDPLMAAPVDYVVLASVVPDPSEQTLVLRDFLSHAQSDHASLAQYLSSDDLVQARAAAHRLKGASRMVGATAVALACAGIEQAASGGQLAAAKDAMASLTLALGSLEEFIGDEVGSE